MGDAFPVGDTKIVFLQLDDPLGETTMGRTVVQQPLQGGMVGNDLKFFSM